MARPEPQLLQRIGEQLDASARPALVVGAAVDRAGAWDPVVALAERYQARVWVAPMSGRAGFPEHHPLFAGFLPAMRERIVELLEGHDLVLALGAPVFTYHVEGAGPHLPAGAQLAQLIDDPAIAAWAPVGLAVVGNIRLGVQDLLARPGDGRVRAAPARRAGAPEPAAPAEGERMSAAYVLHQLDRLRQPGDVVVEEAPSTRPVMQQHLPMRAAGSFYTMCSGGLGYSLPAAVGVALARPGRKVIALIGDGSSLYSIQALWSAAQLRLPITFLILNNRSYAALNMFAPAFGFAPGAELPGTALPGIDFAGLAQAQGCVGLRATDAASLQALLPQALAASVSTLLDIAIA